MLRLEDHQRAVAAGLRQPTHGEPAAMATARAAVLGWAMLGLRSVCPLTAALLEVDGRFRAEVAAQLDLGGRPTSLHRWGRAFSRRLLGDADPLVADVARLELAMLGDEHAARTAPDPWLWPRRPEQVIADLFAGVDPRTRPPAAEPHPVRLTAGVPGGPHAGVATVSPS